MKMSNEHIIIREWNANVYICFIWKNHECMDTSTHNLKKERINWSYANECGYWNPPRVMQVAMQIANQMPIYQSQGMEIVMLCMCTHRIQLYSKSQSYVAVICPCHFETLTVLTRVHTQMLSEWDEQKRRMSSNLCQKLTSFSNTKTCNRSLARYTFVFVI